MLNLKNLDLESRASIGSVGGGSSWLLRLFESNCFDVGIAMQYLHTAKEIGVASYLGNRLFRFPNEEVGANWLYIGYLCEYDCYYLSLLLRWTSTYHS